MSSWSAGASLNWLTRMATTFPTQLGRRCDASVYAILAARPASQTPVKMRRPGTGHVGLREDEEEGVRQRVAGDEEVADDRLRCAAEALAADDGERPGRREGDAGDFHRRDALLFEHHRRAEGEERDGGDEDCR